MVFFVLCSGSNLLFRGFTLISFFLVQFTSFVERNANSTIEQQKCKVHEKRDRILNSKMEFNYQISQKIKVLPIDPVFSNWVNVITFAICKGIAIGF